jgi:hypothetical protein
MADPYLAMYLTLKADFARPSSVVAIRAFAEGAFELGEIIRNDGYFTTFAQAMDAAERIRRRTPRELFVLLSSSLPAQRAIMWRQQSRANLKQLTREVAAVAKPPTLHSRGFADFSLRFGMKQFMPYPDSFVTKDIFEGDVFDIEWNDTDIDVLPAIINQNLFMALRFSHPRGQVFFNHL